MTCPCIFLNKNMNFNKNGIETKMENPTQVLETRNLCFSSYKNYKLKVKLLCVGARERKKRPFFAPFILPEEIFFNICIFSQCITYWIHFQNIHAFTYQKTLLYTLFCLFLESSKAFSVSLIISPLSLHNFCIYLTVKTSYRFRKDFRDTPSEIQEEKKNKTNQILQLCFACHTVHKSQICWLFLSLYSWESHLSFPLVTSYSLKMVEKLSWGSK